MANSVGLIGSGSWATAMIKMLADNKNHKQVNWWVRKQEDIDYIHEHNHNPSYLESVVVDLSVTRLFPEVKPVFDQSEIIILNTPSAYLKDALKDLTPADFEHKIIVTAIKGIIPEDNMVIAEYLQKVFKVKEENIVVVGGPCHAEEVAAEKLSYLTIASKEIKHARMVADLLCGHFINTNLSNDLYGVEFCAVLKNIYALAGGICHGLNYGDNFQAVLVSNAIREMEAFMEAADHDLSRDINQTAYLGDLLVTAYSQFSRNRTFGTMIGKGYSVKSAQVEMNMVAEGYYASACINLYAERYQVKLPICDAVFKILYQHRPATHVIRELSKHLN